MFRLEFALPCYYVHHPQTYASTVKGAQHYDQLCTKQKSWNSSSDSFFKFVSNSVAGWLLCVLAWMIYCKISPSPNVWSSSEKYVYLKQINLWRSLTSRDSVQWIYDVVRIFKEHAILIESYGHFYWIENRFDFQFYMIKSLLLVVIDWFEF